MNNETFFNPSVAQRFIDEGIKDPELAALVRRANAKILDYGKDITIFLVERSFEYSQGALWWRKDWNVTRYELIMWYRYENGGKRHHEFKSYNWPTVPGDKQPVTSYRPFGSPGQVKTYLEGFINGLS